MQVDNKYRRPFVPNRFAKIPLALQCVASSNKLLVFCLACYYLLALFLDRGTNGKLKVFTTIEILNIHALDEVSSLMTLQLRMTLRWVDSRLEFLDLKHEENLNKLTPEEMAEIWMPVLVFTNTKNRQVADFTNTSTFVTIKINEGTSL